MKEDAELPDSLVATRGFASLFWQASVGAGRFDAPIQRRPFVVFFSDGGFILGTNDTDRVDVFDATGQKRRDLLLPLPDPGRVQPSDRRAYEDSIKRSSEREMTAQRYGESLKARFRQQIDLLLSEGAKFPDFRQRYDQLALADGDKEIWVLLPGHGESYTRTWLVCEVSTGKLLQRITVPHRAGVVAATVRGGSLYTIEQSIDGEPRVTRYSAGK